MQTIDYCVLSLYFCALLVIGLLASKKQKNAEDYYIGGRNTGTLSLAALWMSSWVGGAAVVGSAEKSYQLGISSMWYSLSIFCGFVLFAFISAAKIKSLGDKYSHITYSDLIETRYDTKTRVVSTLTTVAAYIGYIASQLVAAAQIIATISDLSPGMSFLVATGVTVAYTALGGFLAVENTDRLQALLILGGITLIAVPLTWDHLGGVHRLATELPPEFFDWGTWGWGTILALITSMILTFFTSMDSYTRCYAARSCASARNGTLIASFLALIISVSVCFLGMSARVLFPESTAGTEGSSALTSIIMLVLPAGLKGLLLVSILSAIMSTADTCILCASANLTRDIYQRFMNPGASTRTILRIGIASSAAVGVAGAFIGWYFKDIMSILIMAFTINSAGLFVPTISAFFWKKGTARAAFWSMTLSLCTVTAWYVGQAVFPDSALLAADPVWPGLLVSTGIYLGLSLTTPENRTESEEAGAHEPGLPRRAGFGCEMD